MNKKVISALLCGAMVLGTVSPVFAAGAAEGKTFAIVTKAAEGGTAIVKHPETATRRADFCNPVSDFSAGRWNLYCR